jgi:hypothetical protein
MGSKTGLNSRGKGRAKQGSKKRHKKWKMKQK